MPAIPKIYGVSDLRTNQAEILDRLNDGPVVLTQRSRAVAVLVSPEQWNRIMNRLEDLQDSLDALEAREDAEPGMDFDEYAAKRD